eukprot:2039286-Lingulodinium_polyedra.AAC.1
MCSNAWSVRSCVPARSMTASLANWWGVPLVTIHGAVSRQSQKANSSRFHAVHWYSTLRT